QLAVAAEIDRIWLTHKSHDSSRIVVNWATDEPGNSVVHFGLTKEYGGTVRIDESTTLHHVEIPLKHRDMVYHYSVSTGDQRSKNATFKAYPTDELRVAVIADWQGQPDLSAIVKEDVHLLLTAGDNIARLWDRCGAGKKYCIEPYAALIDAYPDLFRSTPFLPALGNHDREIRPRGSSPPVEPVYDVDATAFRRFFELPDDEWKWHFDLPEFDLRFVALDFNHISDFGTTWQTCHAFGEDSEQFRWYRKLMEQPPGLVVTLYNERNASVRNQASKQWHDLFRRGTCCITGYGYFAERAEVDGLTYYNTSLSGKGNQYPDPHSKLLAGEDSYVLLTVTRGGPMIVEIRSLKNTVLDRREFQRRGE
ncbi:MAG: metallophosphoesterase, partial [Planctomycetaceae bacterium]|nr:metallophosphoesterase [Planctomycetaceae bacterium]